MAQPEALYRQFKTAYQRGRCLAYVHWALAEWSAEGDLPVDLSRPPAGLSGRANRLAERVREDFLRPAPRWPGNNVRGGWESTGLAGFAAALQALPLPQRQWLNEALRRFVLFCEPPFWTEVPTPERPREFLLSLLSLASQGSLQQGVVYAVATRFYRLAGARVSSRHPFCADKNAHRCGDLHVLRGGRLWLCLEVSCGGFSGARMQRTLARLPEGARALFLCPQPRAARLPAEARDRAAVVELGGFVRLLLDHLDDADVERARRCLEREYLVGLAGGQDYRRYLDFAYRWPRLARMAG